MTDAVTQSAADQIAVIEAQADADVARTEAQAAAQVDVIEAQSEAVEAVEEIRAETAAAIAETEEQTWRSKYETLQVQFQTMTETVQSLQTQVQTLLEQSTQRNLSTVQGNDGTPPNTHNEQTEAPLDEQTEHGAQDVEAVVAVTTAPVRRERRTPGERYL
jgi:hypothetical protein